MSDVEKNSYISFLSEIKSKVYQAQYEAMKQVNTKLVTLYWEIGKNIMKSSSNMAGANQLWNNWHKTYKKNSQEWRA